MAAAAEGIRVVLADDHPLIRLALRDELERAGFEVCAEAATGADAFDAAVREQPDLCLLDVTMPEGDGIVTAAAIKDELPATRVVLITAEATFDGALAAARAGADGYLDKDIEPARLPLVLAGVLEGEKAFPRRLLADVIGVA